MAENNEVDQMLYGTFPQGFAWGVATASYQIEGAWNEEGKGENIWDAFCHEKGHVDNDDTGDIACNSYHMYKEDVKLIKGLGLSHYRFSLSWARILPNGTVSLINQPGIDYYNRLIDDLLSAGIQPFITLYHWDLPKALHDIGGWTNEALIDHFNDYARLCFTKFGDRVKLWSTFNEPLCTTWFGYGNGEHAPGITDPLGCMWTVAHTIIKSHAKAWHTYDKEFRPTQSGKIGIVMVANWSQAKDPNNPKDIEAAERTNQLKIGWFTNPIFANGDYPTILKAQLASKAKELGLPVSPLPVFTDDEKKFIRGTFDYFGINHYTTRIVSHAEEPQPPVSEAGIMDAIEEIDPQWKRAASKWLYVVPHGIRRTIAWVKDHYGNIPIYVTENGYSDDSGTLEDDERVEYYRAYINQVLKAVVQDGCDVRGYMAWSLLDNFEWARGYTERFGLHRVDFKDPKRRRTPRTSAAVYAKIVNDNGFPDTNSVDSRL